MKQEETENHLQATHADEQAEQQETPVAQTAEAPLDTSATPDPVATLKEQLQESRNKYLYLVADFDNYKRHAAKERIEMREMAGRDILSAMIPILDDFDRAAKNGALGEGVELIHHKLIHTLQTKGLRMIETKAGDAFDIDRQEAIVKVPVPSEDLKGKVVDVIEQGYQLGERVIRFAKVVIGE